MVSSLSSQHQKKIPACWIGIFLWAAVVGGVKQSTVQRSAFLKLPCNALFISLILPDRRQIYSFRCLAVIESLSPRVSKISSLQRCCLKPLPLSGLWEDRDATKSGPLEITQLRFLLQGSPSTRMGDLGWFKEHHCMQGGGPSSCWKIGVGSWLPPLYLHREPQRHLNASGRPLALLWATAPLATA